MRRVAPRKKWLFSLLLTTLAALAATSTATAAFTTPPTSLSIRSEGLGRLQIVEHPTWCLSISVLDAGGAPTTGGNLVLLVRRGRTGPWTTYTIPVTSATTRKCFVEPEGTSQIWYLVFADSNGNGIQDPDEPSYDNEGDTVGPPYGTRPCDVHAAGWGNQRPGYGPTAPPVGARVSLNANVRFDGPGALRGTVTLRGPSVELRSVQIRSVYCANGTDYAPSYPVTQAWITGVATVNGSARHRFVLILRSARSPNGSPSTCSSTRARRRRFRSATRT
jgi:hypothetical protein